MTKIVLTTLVSTSLYCCIVPLFIQFDNASLANGSLLVNIVTGQLLICAVATFINRTIFLAATLPPFATLIMFDFFPDSDADPAMYLAATLAYCALLYVGNHARKIFTDSLSVKIQHDKLIQDLASEKAKSDASLYRIEHANKRLLQSEQLFRALVDNTFDTTLLTDKHGHIRYASPSSRQIGFTKEELVGRPIQSIFKIQGHNNGLDWLDAMAAGGKQSIQFKEAIISSDGEAVWIEGSLRDLRNEPNVEGIILNLRNITERKHADDELRIHLRVLDALATSKSLDEVLEILCQSLDQSLPDAQAGIVLLDENLVVIKSILPSAEGSIEDLIPKGPLNPDDHAMARALQTGEPVFVENADTSHLTQAVAAVQKRNGRTFKGVWTFPIYDRQAKPLGSVNLLLTTARQPTARERALLHSAIHLVNLAVERRRSEDDLLLATERAEMANRAKSSFLATMSHELRTPLNAIIGFSDIMKGEMFGPLENERYAEYTNDIYNSGRHLLSVIDDILDISKIEAGRYDVEESEVSLIDVINWCADLIRPKIQEKQQTLTLGLIHNVVAWVDRRAARQVMLNLLSNAAKFTPEGGTIQVLGSITETGELEIMVKDNGIGIPKEMLDLVMQPFAQVSSHTAREYEGTGLGLPICKALLELHDGAMNIESEQGEGTTITITLPKERVLINHDKSLKA
ncbi:MAG: PAS domain S-box protein [Parvibaculaceae bacterium]|nr:PAS domain S-box protein [Parvibaculaceae bacterium]